MTYNPPSLPGCTHNRYPVVDTKGMARYASAGQGHICLTSSDELVDACQFNSAIDCPKVQSPLVFRPKQRIAYAEIRYPNPNSLRLPDFFKRVFAPPNCLSPGPNSPDHRRPAPTLGHGINAEIPVATLYDHVNVNRGSSFRALRRPGRSQTIMAHRTRRSSHRFVHSKSPLNQQPKYRRISYEPTFGNRTRPLCRNRRFLDTESGEEQVRYVDPDRFALSSHVDDSYSEYSSITSFSRLDPDLITCADFCKSLLGSDFQDTESVGHARTVDQDRQPYLTHATPLISCADSQRLLPSRSASLPLIDQRAVLRCTAGSGYPIIRRGKSSDFNHLTL